MTEMTGIRTLALLALGCAAATALAQNYPARAIRVVVPSAPGGGTDFVARVIGPPLYERLKQPLVIDNRGGAGGTVGTDIAAKAPADGYTLLLVFVNFSIFPSLYSHLAFDPVRDFEPISMVAKTPLVLVVNPQVPAKSVREFIALAKGGKALNYAAPGVGSLGHLAGELFKASTGIDMPHIPYKGGGPSISALLAGEVQAYFSTMPAALAQVKAGKLRALAVTSAKRAATEPDIPTIAESGVAGYDVTGWFGLLAPKKTPRPIIMLLNHEAAAVLALPEVKQRLTVGGVEPAPGTPEEFGATIKAEIEKWARVVKVAGLRAE